MGRSSSLRHQHLTPHEILIFDKKLFNFKKKILAQIKKKMKTLLKLPKTINLNCLHDATLISSKPMVATVSEA